MWETPNIFGHKFIICSPFLPVLTRQAYPERARTAVSSLSGQALQVRGPGEEQVRTELVAQCRGAELCIPFVIRFRMPKPTHKTPV